MSDTRPITLEVDFNDTVGSGMIAAEWPERPLPLPLRQLVDCFDLEGNRCRATIEEQITPMHGDSVFVHLKLDMKTWVDAPARLPHNLLVASNFWAYTRPLVSEHVATDRYRTPRAEEQVYA